MSVNSTVARTRSTAGIAREEKVVGAVELDELGPGDALSEVATHLKPHHPVVPPVEHKRRHLDRGQHVADVQLRIEREDVADHARAGGHALQPCPPPPQIGITPPARSPSTQSDALTPALGAQLDQRRQLLLGDAKRIVGRSEQAGERAV